MKRCSFKLRSAFAVLLLFSVIRDGKAQVTLLSQKVDTSGKISKIGPNRLFFAHGTSKSGLTFWPQSRGMQTNWWSGSIAYGVRMKLRASNWYSLVCDFDFRYDRFSISQKTPKALPFETVRHRKERISVHNLSLLLGNRFNAGRRGNSLGRYLDFGIYGDWVFRTSHVIIDRTYNSSSPDGSDQRIRVKNTGLPYIENFNYGLFVRIGGNLIGLFATYRWNEIIIDPPGFEYPDLPALTIGIEVYSWGR